MLSKYIKRRRLKKKIRVTGSQILDDLASVIVEALNVARSAEHPNADIQEEALKFEVTAFTFWLFRASTLFDKEYHKLLLDEVHEQYFTQLYKRGYGYELREKISNSLNKRYRAYDEALAKESNFTKVGVIFTQFVADSSESELSLEHMTIPLFLIDKTTSKLNKWKAHE